MIRIVASMLTADLADLGGEVRRLEAAGIDGIHWDVMDGIAVPSLTFGPAVIASARPHATVPFEAHLMIRDPDDLIERVAAAGCTTALVHPDMLKHPWRTCERIREAGMRVGVTLSPGIPLEDARWLLPLTDVLMIMTVEPGFGGQAYLTAMEAKVAEARRLLDGFEGEWELEIDGGVGPGTIAGAHGAGARTFVVGSALWRAGSFGEALEACRAACAD